MSSISSASHIFQETLQTAIYNVNCLDEIPARLDGPCIQASTPTVHYQVNYNTNFKDRNAFKTSRAKSMEEAQHHSVLNDILEKGHEFAITLYTWRTIAVSLPQPQSNDDPDRDGIYVSIYKVLEPAIAKLREFMQFINNATAKFCDEVRRSSLVDRKNDSINEAYLLTLGKMLRMFALLDRMKLMSSGIRNDLSYFRRAHQYLRTPGVDVLSMMEVEQDSQELSKFVAEQYNITRLLQTSIHPIAHYEDLLADIISTCANMYEQKRYVLPDEKHRLVIIIAYALQLLENTPQTMNKDKREVKEKDLITLSKMTKKINVPKIDKILKECKTINLFGDMFIDPFDYVQLMPSYKQDSDKWVQCTSHRISIQGDLLTQMPRLKEEYDEIIREIALLNHRPDNKLSIPQQRIIMDTSLRILKSLSNWTLSVIELFTWKLANPTNSHDNPDCPADAGSYELATKYNFSPNEKLAFVALIGMIKSCQAMLQDRQSVCMEAIKCSMYLQVQFLVNHTLAEAMKWANQNKKAERLKRSLMNIQIYCTDEAASADSGYASSTLSSSTGRKGTMQKGTLSRKDANRLLAMTEAASALTDAAQKQRRITLSSTQMYYLRVLLEAVLYSSSKKETLKVCLSDDAFKSVEDFYSRVFYWPYLLNFTDSLDKCCDLSQLWFREFFINMRMTNIQFPIESSLPWILVSHLLDTEDSAHMDYLLYCLDLYNDAAQCALYHFQRQHLYDEIEEESKLVFEQLSFHLCNKIFQHYLHKAGCVLLNQRFQTEYNATAVKQQYRVIIPPDIYCRLMQQRQISILGRTVNLNHIIAIKMNKKILTSLQSIIKWFSKEGLSSVVELEAALQSNRLCHQFLSEYLDLDDFDSILAEANETVTCSVGLIVERIYVAVNTTMVPFYCYNTATQRFVRSVDHPDGEEAGTASSSESQLTWGSRSLNYCYKSIFKLYSNFIGQQHFAAIARLMNYDCMGKFYAGLLMRCSELVNGELKSLVAAALDAMPCSNNSANDFFLQCRSTPNTHIGNLWQSYMNHLTQLKPHLHPLCDKLRQLGNIFLFCYHLEQCQNVEEVFSWRFKFPFLGVELPNQPWESKAPGAADTNLERKRREISSIPERYANLNVLNVLHTLQDPNRLEVASDNVDRLTSERLTRSLSLLPKFLHTVQAHLQSDPLWFGGNVDDAQLERRAPEFYRLWSAVEFLAGVQETAETDRRSIGAHYGDGFHWGGTMLVILLKQWLMYQAFSVCQHYSREHKQATQSTELFRRFATRFHQFRALNDQVLGVVEAILSEINPTESNIFHYAPPVFVENAPFPADANENSSFMTAAAAPVEPVL